MSDYWKKHYEANAERFSASPLRQVDRTINGVELGADQMALTVDAVVQSLSLGKNDRVMDLCCGNGLITEMLAETVESILAVDFSEKLIRHAKGASRSANVRYIVADASALPPSAFDGINKLYMRDSVSCLDDESLSRLLRSLAQATALEAAFIAGVPDADRLHVYYDDEQKMAFYRERQSSGRPHIGTWWSREDMRQLVEDAGLRVRFLPQAPALGSAFYRYDCIVQPG